MKSSDIRHGDFRRIDLNLLVAFDALILERHVGRAAARVFLGQPAMSHVLARLREALNDPLFVRLGNNMEPTTLALEIAPQVRAWLKEANQFLFYRNAFDLSRVKTTIRVATIGGVETVLLPPLMAKLQHAAPGINVWAKYSQREHILPALDGDEIDMAIGPAQLPFKERHCGENVLREQIMCIYSARLLKLPKTITPDILSAQQHVAMSYRGDSGSDVDHFFASRELKRNVVVNASCQLTIARLLQQFPFVSMQPSTMASIYNGMDDIVVSPVADDDLAMDLRLIWHQRNDKDPANAYVRKAIKEVLAANDVSVAPKTSSRKSR